MASGDALPSAPMRSVRAETAEDMHAVTLAEAAVADVVVMAAAVADYRPVEPAAGKRPKDERRWVVELQPTVDILAELGRTRRDGQTLIGFAAEHGEGAVERARDKLERKRADMIVMNDISRPDIGFDSTHNEIVLVTSKGESTVSRRSKEACASAIWDAVGNQSASRAVEQRTTA
jgi:phosphopantothenoylcysteine decarboxylase / phosphopantothenate---cysteine ligase